MASQQQSLLASYNSGALPGQQEFTTAGNHTWLCPAGVTSISVVCVGAGASGSGYLGAGGGGGALAYKNNISVVPGTSYLLSVGAGGVPSAAPAGMPSNNRPGANGGDSYFAHLPHYQHAVTPGPMTTAGGGQIYGGATGVYGYGIGGLPSGDRDGGGDGGGCPGPYSRHGGSLALIGSAQYFGSGGGGAGGYSGAGGNGGGAQGGYPNNYTHFAATNGAGGGGGGGQGQPQEIGSQQGDVNTSRSGGSGGGVGIEGLGPSGIAGRLNPLNVANPQYNACGGQAGSNGVSGYSPNNQYSGGANVDSWTDSTNYPRTRPTGRGGAYGGGGGAGGYGNQNSGNPGSGAGGAVRIIWPGASRSFPSTKTWDLYPNQLNQLPVFSGNFIASGDFGIEDLPIGYQTNNVNDRTHSYTRILTIRHVATGYSVPYQDSTTTIISFPKATGDGPIAYEWQFLTPAQFAGTCTYGTASFFPPTVGAQIAGFTYATPYNGQSFTDSIAGSLSSTITFTGFSYLTGNGYSGAGGTGNAQNYKSIAGYWRLKASNPAGATYTSWLKVEKRWNYYTYACDCYCEPQNEYTYNCNCQCCCGTVDCNCDDYGRDCEQCCHCGECCDTCTECYSETCDTCSAYQYWDTGSQQSCVGWPN